MDVRGEIAHGGRDAPVEGAAERQVPAEAHARGADAAGAGGEGEEGGDGEGGVFVVGVDFLGGGLGQIGMSICSRGGRGRGVCCCCCFCCREWMEGEGILFRFCIYSLRRYRARRRRGVLGL